MPLVLKSMEKKWFCRSRGSGSTTHTGENRNEQSVGKSSGISIGANTWEGKTLVKHWVCPRVLAVFPLPRREKMKMSFGRRKGGIGVAANTKESENEIDYWEHLGCYECHQYMKRDN